jgi:hypothetical protein
LPDFELSYHAKEMMVERNVAEEWVWRVLQHPDKTKLGEDGNRHFFKAIRERNGKILHVVINPNVQPHRVVTLFFDRQASERM